jgi:AIR synthase-related protein
MLADWLPQWQQALGILHKRDIQTAAHCLGAYVSPSGGSDAVRLGDDCAALPDGEGYLLLAAEGMWPTLVQEDPWFAGWCSVLVNVSDIYAMGGHPMAVVDALWSDDPNHSAELWAGMRAASQVFNVPIVGGHSNQHSPYQALSVAILGRSRHLITSFDAQPGEVLVLAVNLAGKPHPRYPFWDAATQADPALLRRQLALLPQLAESGLCKAGKDVSMGGILGTTLMLLETSGVGAVLDLDAVPRPETLPFETWMLSFPSYGFLLSVLPERVPALVDHFASAAITCAAIAQVTDTRQLVLAAGGCETLFWDFSSAPLTGFGPPT